MIDLITRLPVIVMGLTIGTADGWDHHGDFLLQFYDFEPDAHAVAVGFIPGDLVFAFNEGTIEYHNDAGEETANFDMLTILQQYRERSQKDEDR